MNKLNHVAFIMDGNGRWGEKNKKNRNLGHLKGVETVKKIVKSSIKLKIPIISFYVFSSENWKRPKGERKYLFSLIENYFSKEITNIVKRGIKINILGETQKLTLKLRNVLKKTEKLTKGNSRIILNLAINYGSKNEILFALKKLKGNLSQKKLEHCLYTKNMPHPDILIRTGGYQRLSNFFLWQLAYTELFFLKKLWQDFNSRDLSNVIKKFKKIKRNYGNI